MADDRKYAILNFPEDPRDPIDIVNKMEASRFLFTPNEPPIDLRIRGNSYWPDMRIVVTILELAERTQRVGIPRVKKLAQLTGPPERAQELQEKWRNASATHALHDLLYNAFHQGVEMTDRQYEDLINALTIAQRSKKNRSMFAAISKLVQRDREMLTHHTSDQRRALMSDADWQSIQRNFAQLKLIMRELRNAPAEDISQAAETGALAASEIASIFTNYANRSRKRQRGTHLTSIQSKFEGLSIDEAFAQAVRTEDLDAIAQLAPHI